MLVLLALGFRVFAGSYPGFPDEVRLEKAVEYRGQLKGEITFAGKKRSWPFAWEGESRVLMFGGKEGVWIEITVRGTTKTPFGERRRAYTLQELVEPDIRRLGILRFLENGWEVKRIRVQEGTRIREYPGKLHDQLAWEYGALLVFSLLRPDFLKYEEKEARGYRYRVRAEGRLPQGKTGNAYAWSLRGFLWARPEVPWGLWDAELKISSRLLDKEGVTKRDVQLTVLWKGVRVADGKASGGAK